MERSENAVELPNQKPTQRGRQRSLAAEEAILKATLFLLERRSLVNITADAIAARAKVSKATIYKWWPNKNRVALDAILSRAQADLPIPDTGSALQDFTEHLQRGVGFYTSSPGKAAVQFLAASQNDPELQKLFREHFQLSRRADLKLIFDRAIARGEIRADIDIDIAIDLLFAPMVYRLLAGHMPVDENFARTLVRTVFDGIRVIS